VGPPTPPEVTSLKEADIPKIKPSRPEQIFTSTYFNIVPIAKSTQGGGRRPKELARVNFRERSATTKREKEVAESEELRLVLKEDTCFKDLKKAEKKRLED